MARALKKTSSRKTATKAKAPAKPTLKSRAAKAGKALGRAASAAGRMARKAGSAAQKVMKRAKGSRTAKIAAGVVVAAATGLAVRRARKKKRRW